MSNDWKRRPREQTGIGIDWWRGDIDVTPARRDRWERPGDRTDANYQYVVLNRDWPMLLSGGMEWRGGPGDWPRPGGAWAYDETPVAVCNKATGQSIDEAGSQATGRPSMGGSRNDLLRPVNDRPGKTVDMKWWQTIGGNDHWRYPGVTPVWRRTGEEEPTGKPNVDGDASENVIEDDSSDQWPRRATLIFEGPDLLSGGE